MQTAGEGFRDLNSPFTAQARVDAIPNAKPEEHQKAEQRLRKRLQLPDADQLVAMLGIGNVIGAK